MTTTNRSDGSTARSNKHLRRPKRGIQKSGNQASLSGYFRVLVDRDEGAPRLIGQIDIDSSDAGWSTVPILRSLFEKAIRDSDWLSEALRIRVLEVRFEFASKGLTAEDTVWDSELRSLLLSLRNAYHLHGHVVEPQTAGDSPGERHYGFRFDGSLAPLPSQAAPLPSDVLPQHSRPAGNRTKDALTPAEALAALLQLGPEIKAAHTPRLAQLQRILNALAGHEFGTRQEAASCVRALQIAKAHLGASLELESDDPQKDGLRVSVVFIDDPAYATGRIRAYRSTKPQKPVASGKGMPKLRVVPFADT